MDLELSITSSYMCDCRWRFLPSKKEKIKHWLSWTWFLNYYKWTDHFKVFYLTFFMWPMTFVHVFKLNCVTKLHAGLYFFFLSLITLIEFTHRHWPELSRSRLCVWQFSKTMMMRMRILPEMGQSCCAGSQKAHFIVLSQHNVPYLSHSWASSQSNNSFL